MVLTAMSSEQTIKDLCLREILHKISQPPAGILMCRSNQ
jgi:hypothetical protein